MGARMSGEHRKLCILEAVRGLFSKKGLTATSKEISKAAGVSEALIYKHFINKEGLYAALLEHSCRAPENVGKELAQMKPSTEVLVCATYLLVKIMHEGVETPEEIFRLSPKEMRGLVIQSLQEDGDVARTLFENGLGPWVQNFVAGLKAAKKSGDLVDNETDYESLIWMSHHAILGLTMTFQSTPSSYKGKFKNQDDLKDQILTYCLRGMGLKTDAIQKAMKGQLFNEFKTQINNQEKS